MKLVLKKKTSAKVSGRLKKKVRIRKRIHGTPEKPRLCVFKSLKHIYGSLIDDTTGKVIFTFSSLKVDEKLNGIDMAKRVGLELAKKAKDSSFESVVFDRNGFLYHGRIKSLADGAREGGLNF